jgi:hypothetical protein
MPLADIGTAVTDLLKLPPKPLVTPPDVKEALDRGRKEMVRDAAKRRLCMRFERGDAYTFIDSKGFLANQATSLDIAGGKPQHRIRNSFNHIRPLVEDKVSAATSQIPAYRVDATTEDPEDQSAADVAEKVALYGYDRWHLRRMRMKVVKSAIAHGGDGFAFPYFEPNVGPYHLVQNANADGSDEWVGEGEVRIITLGGNEVYWEAGVEFDHSRWYAIERARPVDEVMQTPGFFGSKLTADANTSDVATDAQQIAAGNLVMVTDYFERPCPKWPEGRRIQMANGRVIVDWRQVDPTTSMPWEPYPLRDHDDKVIDEPIIHRLSYTIDPDSDRDLGLVWQLIDAQRTINDCLNKLLEWKNRCLNPQMVAAVGSMITRPNDEPGFIHYHKMGMPPPTWQPTPQIPQELFQIYNTMTDAMRFIASYADATAGPNVAAATVQADVEQSQARWKSFLGDLAEFDSRLMRHCLLLVSRFYNEPRLLKINGWFGPDRVSDFMGSQLNGQVDVRVPASSLEQISKSDLQNRVSFIAQTFPGYLSPEVALAAMDNGSAANLVRSYIFDEAKVGRIILRIRNGTVMQMPTRHEMDLQTGAPLMIPGPIDPVTGQPGPPVEAEVPGYMPIPDVDNLTVWRKGIGDWMKTPDYEQLDAGLQEVPKQILAAINQLEMRAQQQQIAQQQAAAAKLGLGAASTPAGAPPAPDQPAPPT